MVPNPIYTLKTLKSLPTALASSHSRLLYLTAYETYMQGLKGSSNSEESHRFPYFLHIQYSSLKTRHFPRFSSSQVPHPWPHSPTPIYHHSSTWVIFLIQNSPQNSLMISYFPKDKTKTHLSITQASVFSLSSLTPPLSPWVPTLTYLHSRGSWTLPVVLWFSAVFPSRSLADAISSFSSLHRLRPPSNIRKLPPSM